MTQEARKLRNSIFFIFTFTLMLWLVKALELAVHIDFGFLGILPRTLSGTMGIVTAPLVHGDVLHLLSNTFPLLLLGISVFYFYDRIALEVFVWIYFMSGFWVWMAARDAYHIGASGIVYGLVSFLFFSGLFRRDVRSLSISLIVIFLYGGMVQGLFPINERISWESHLLGALAGAFCAFFYRDTKIIYSQTETTAELEPAYASQAKSYQEMQNSVDMYDAPAIGIYDAHDSGAIYDVPTAAAAHDEVPVVTAISTKPAITLHYQYYTQPPIPTKIVAPQKVAPYKFNASDITDKRYVFNCGYRKKTFKPESEEPVRTAAA